MSFLFVCLFFLEGGRGGYARLAKALYILAKALYILAKAWGWR